MSGDVVPLGTGGLIGWALTNRVTQADIDDFNKVTPQGLKDGEASFELVGVSTAVKLTVNAAIAQWAPVYRTPTGLFSPTDTGNTMVGFALATTTAAGIVPVGLSR